MPKKNARMEHISLYIGQKAGKINIWSCVIKEYFTMLNLLFATVTGWTLKFKEQWSILRIIVCVGVSFMFRSKITDLRR